MDRSDAPDSWWMYPTMAIMVPLRAVRARGIPVEENIRSRPEDVATAIQPSPAATARADSPEFRLTVKV